MDNLIGTRHVLTDGKEVIVEGIAIDEAGPCFFGKATGRDETVWYDSYDIERTT